MNPKIDQLYQEIGQEALAAADALAGKTLVYAEIEAGVISADIFFATKSSGVQFRFCPKPMQALIYSLWEHWKALPGNREWRVMCYVIDGGKFNIDLTYPDGVKEEEELSDRRPRAVLKYFGDQRVDYSRMR